METCCAQGQLFSYFFLYRPIGILGARGNGRLSPGWMGGRRLRRFSPSSTPARSDSARERKEEGEGQMTRIITREETRRFVEALPPHRFWRAGSASAPPAFAPRARSPLAPPSTSARWGGVTGASHYEPDRRQAHTAHTAPQGDYASRQCALHAACVSAPWLLLALARRATCSALERHRDCE